MDKIADKVQSLKTGEKIILIAGAVLFVAGFLPWYSIDLGVVSLSRNAWQSPGALWSTLPVLIGLAMFGVIAVKAFTDVVLPDNLAGQSWAKVHLAGGALAFLSVIIKFVNESSYMGYGFYLGFLAAAALAVAGYLMFKEESGTRSSLSNITRFRN